MEFSYTISMEEAAISIEQFLTHQGFSKKLIQMIKQSGMIRLNEVPQSTKQILRLNDVLQIFYEEIQRTHFEATEMPLDIVYEDDYLLVLNKPRNLDTIPTKRNNDYTLANGIKFYFETKGIQANIHFISRLDKTTSGLILIAKSGYIHHLFSQVSIDKKYQAIVLGEIFQDQTIEAPISREQAQHMKRVVSPSGDYAKTCLKVVWHNAGYSFLELTLVTGRTHQIRVHLSYLGHPIYGDTLYGGAQLDCSSALLHCSEYTFLHPMTHQLMHITQALPIDMKMFYEKMKKGSI